MEKSCESKEPLAPLLQMPKSLQTKKTPPSPESDFEVINIQKILLQRQIQKNMNHILTKTFNRLYLDMGLASEDFETHVKTLLDLLISSLEAGNFSLYMGEENGGKVIIIDGAIPFSQRSPIGIHLKYVFSQEEAEGKTGINPFSSEREEIGYFDPNFIKKIMATLSPVSVNTWYNNEYVWGYEKK